MSDLLLWLGIFLISMAVLVKAADYFTEAAEKIGLYFGLPAFIVGVTIVAVGTSLPELITSIIAATGGNSEIVAGNVIGSNIANIFLVLGIAAIIARKMQIEYELSQVDLPLLVGSAFLMAITIWDGIFTWKEGILCLLLLAVYLLYTIQTGEKHPQKIKKEMKGVLVKKEKIKASTWITLAASAVFLYLGAKYTVDSLVQISDILNIGKDIIAASAVALGTSLPELTVTINSARKGKGEIAIGNVLGSNIFNSLAVMGIPAFFGVLVVPAGMITFALPMMIIATLLYFFITQVKHVTRWEGWMLVIFYVLFIGKLFGLF